MKQFRMSCLLLISLFTALPAHAQQQEALEHLAENLTIWQLVASAEWWVLVPIALLSFLVIGLIVFNFFILRRNTIASQVFLHKASRYLDDHNLEGLLSLCESSNEAVPRILGRVLEFARENPAVDLQSLEKLAESEGGRLSVRMNQPTQLIMDLGVMAPMVGLFGTVVGILRSFGTIASEDVAMRTTLLAGGVSQALVATALGLVVGLLAMFFYALFRAQVQNILTYMEATLTELLVRILQCLATAPPTPSGKSDSHERS